MKKVFSLFLFVLVLLFVYSCNLQMPTAVEIRATPELEFSASFNFSEYLREMIDFEGDNENLYDCINTEDMTYLFYKVLSEEINIEFNKLDDIEIGYSPSSPIVLYDSGTSGGAITIPARDLDDDNLRDFRFAETQSKLYVSGSKISEKLTIEIWIGSDDSSSKQFNGINSNFNDTLINRSNSTFAGTALPPNGSDIDILDSDVEVEVNFRIYIDTDKTIYADDKVNPHVKVEIASWLPFILVAVNKNNEAEIKLPQDLFSDEDLFGRESANDNNMIESLHLSIGLNKNPFTGATLVVKSGDIEFENPMSSTAMGFPITETMMQNINRSFPFSPKLSLRFKEGGSLSIPRNFHTTGVYFKARINYRIDL